MLLLYVFKFRLMYWKLGRAIYTVVPVIAKCSAYINSCSILYRVFGHRFSAAAARLHRVKGGPVTEDF